MHEFIDRTGESRRDSEIEEAFQLIRRRMVKFDISDPELTVLLPIIKDALEELLTIRKARKAKGIEG